MPGTDPLPDGEVLPGLRGEIQQAMMDGEVEQRSIRMGTIYRQGMTLFTFHWNGTKPVTTNETTNK